MHELKEALNQAKRALIVLPENASDADYLAALQLQKIAPEKTIIHASDEKEREWGELFGLPLQKKEFAITIDTSHSPIEELRYEKDDTALTIFLSHTRPLDTASIRYNEHVPSADLIISVGFADRQTAENHIATLSLKGTFQHVWLGSATPPQSTTPPLLKKLPTTSANLLGRLMARSRNDIEMKTLWSFLTKEDFIKTDSRSEDIPALLKTFRAIASLPEIIIVFWQSPTGDATDGIIESINADISKNVAVRIGHAPPHNGYTALPQFANFVEAETETRKLLRQLS